MVLIRAVGSDFTLSNNPQMCPVVRFSISLSALEQAFAGNPAILVCNLLGNGNRQILGRLNRADKLRGLEERLHGAGIEPRVATPKRHDV